jgi:hypothetical protein
MSDTVDRGFITRGHAPGGGLVSVSDAGAEHLRHHCPAAASVVAQSSLAREI